MKVSVIIPVYQVEDYIEACISSVIAQTHQHLEIILVDDCGDDSSIVRARRLLEVSGRDWRILHHASNRGLSAARNTGVNAATGDSVFFLDSDDSLRHDAIEHLATLQAAHRAEVVLGSTVMVTPTGEELPTQQRIRHSRLLSEPFVSLLNREFYISAWARLIDRSFYLTNGFSFREGILYEDEPWCVWLALRAKRVYVSEKIVYHYTQRENSIMSQAEVSPKAVHSHMVLIGLIHEYLTLYYEGDRKTVRKWFYKRVSACLRKINACKQFNRGKKLQLCKELYARYPWLSTCGFAPSSILRTTCILSLFMPRHYALYVSMRLWSGRK